MKKTYPIYTADRNNPVTEKVFNSLSKRNREAILKFLEVCSVKSKSQKREFGRKTCLIKVFDFLEKDYNKITYEDYVKIAKAISESPLGVYSKNGDRDTLKRFLRENYPNWREKFKELKLLSSETQSEDKKLTSNDLITEKEIDKMIKATTNMIHKSLIVTLDETASRPEELLKTRWNDIDFKKGLIYLYSSKQKRKDTSMLKIVSPT